MASLIGKLIDLFFTPRTAAWTKGDKAYRDGTAEDSNPYHESTSEHSQWVAGYYGRNCE